MHAILYLCVFLLMQGERNADQDLFWGSLVPEEQSCPLFISHLTSTSRIWRMISVLFSRESSVAFTIRPICIPDLNPNLPNANAEKPIAILHFLRWPCIHVATGILELTPLSFHACVYCCYLPLSSCCSYFSVAVDA